MTDGTIEQWAERVAPTLDTHAWDALNRWASGHDCVIKKWAVVWRWEPEERHALLTYRDKVAAMLSRSERGFLRDLCRAEQTGSSNYRRLVRFKLARERTELWTCATNLGRAVLRMLESEGA